MQSFIKTSYLLNTSYTAGTAVSLGEPGCYSGCQCSAPLLRDSPFPGPPAASHGQLRLCLRASLGCSGMLRPWGLTPAGGAFDSQMRVGRKYPSVGATLGRAPRLLPEVLTGNATQLFVNTSSLGCLPSHLTSLTP